MNNELYLEYQRYTRLLLSRKRFLVIVALLVMTVGVLTSYLLPKKYEAQSTVFIEESVISDLVKGIAITPTMIDKINVLSVSMLSRNTLSKVMRILDKDVALETEALREAYMMDLRKRITIKLDEKRGIFFITFVDRDPRFTRDFVNTMTQVYIESNTASKRDESLVATRFLSDQLAGIKKRIDVVDEEINQYRAAHGLKLTVDENMIRFELANADKQLESIRARRFELETQERLAPTGGGQSGGLAQMERQLASLRAIYTENHPKVVRLKGEIAVVKASPSRGMTGDGGAGRTMAYIQAELQANKAAEEAQLRVIEDNMKLLGELPSLRTGLSELMRKKESDIRLYDQLMTRLSQSEMSKQMEMENKSMTFRIVDPAVLPEKPISPPRLLIMLGSLLGGICISIALIILPHMFGGAIDTLSDLRVFNLRILGVMPLIPKPEEARLRKRADRFFMAGAACYFSMLLAVGVLEVMGKPYVEQILGRIVGV
jgi:polysaccharide biosynthesis transport protein